MVEDRVNQKVGYIRRLELQAMQVQPLAKALRALIEANPAFRLKPLGGEGSPARLQQEAHIAAEDVALRLLAEIER